MIITESFVMLNYPKTGSSFARKVIKELYQRYPRRFFKRRFIKELMLPNIREAGNAPPDQHGTYSQIPREYRDREIVTVVRNPFDRFLSGYEFRHWAHYPPLPMDVIRMHFPQFPKLTIEQYIAMNQMVIGLNAFLDREPRARIGEQTVQFIHLFFKNPRRVLAEISDEYMDSDRVFDDMAEITFLRQERLNEELAAFLRRKGFTRRESAFIESHEPVNVTVGKNPDRERLWTQRALDYVREYERTIFRILEARGISYGRPLVKAA